MTVITLVNIHIPGYIHSAAYADLITSVRCGLITLGYEVRERRDFRTTDTPCIVFGAHLLGYGGPQTNTPENAIIYNTEHISSLAIQYDTYCSLLCSAAHVWDYSADNAVALSKLLGRPVRHVPFGYVPELTRITPAAEQDIDVLFYGAMNDRRLKIIQDLQAAGLLVVNLFGVYGRQLDAYIARAKVVLNMHFYLPGHFESLRVGYLLANKKAVVCEANFGETLPDPGMYIAPYELLVKSCLDVVADNAWRKRFEIGGFGEFGDRDEPTILREALSATWGEGLIAPQKSRREDYRPEFMAKLEADWDKIDWSASPSPTQQTLNTAALEGYNSLASGTLDLTGIPMTAVEWVIADQVPPFGTFEISGDVAIMASTPDTGIPAAEQDQPLTSRHLIVGSGKSYDPTALNLDIDERWKPDVVADISDAALLPARWVSVGNDRLQREGFTKITASHVLEHIPNLVQAMTNCLDLLADGGEMHITVPYDLSYGAWQDPTHVRAFNERSWLYYTDWWWYLSWETHRFDLVSCEFWAIRGDIHGYGGAWTLIQEADALAPRNVDEMRVVLRKRPLTDAEKAEGQARHGAER